MCGGDAACCEITLTTCLELVPVIVSGSYVFDYQWLMYDSRIRYWFGAHQAGRCGCHCALRYSEREEQIRQSTSDYEVLLLASVLTESGIDSLLQND